MSDADDTLAGLVEVPKAEAGLLLEAGYLYLEMGRPKEAEEVFAGVAALLPGSDVPRIALGNLSFAQGRFQRALKYHQEALSLRPDSADAQAHVGEALLFLKRKDEGVQALEDAIRLAPEGAAATFARALLDAVAAGEL